MRLVFLGFMIFARYIFTESFVGITLVFITPPNAVNTLINNYLPLSIFTQIYIAAMGQKIAIFKSID